MNFFQDHRTLLLTLGPAVALCALVAAWLASRQLGQLRAQADDWSGFSDRVAEQAFVLDSLPRAAAPAPRPEPEVTEPVTRRPRTALEERIDLILEFTQPLLRSLGRWSAAAGVTLDELSEHSRSLQQLGDELTESPSDARAEAAEQEIRAILPELFPLLITRTDRDLDPQAANPQLQQALQQALHNTKYALIAPQPGEPFDPRMHVSLGIFARGTPQQRGTVGQVRCRGLRLRTDILLKAEVLEFD